MTFVFKTGHPLLNIELLLKDTGVFPRGFISNEIINFSSGIFCFFSLLLIFSPLQVDWQPRREMAIKKATVPSLED